MLTAITKQSSSNYILDASDTATFEDICSTLSTQVGSPGASVDIPPKPGLQSDESMSSLRFGARVGVGVEPAITQIPNGLCLVVVSGPSAGDIFKLPFGTHVIGRSGDIVLRDATLSRRHANVTVTNDGNVSICDLGSVNGTFVEGIRVPSDSTELNLGDAVGLGETVVELRRMSPEAAVIETGESGWINFIRPPRIIPGDQTARVDFPAEPVNMSHRALPIASMLIPIIMGGLMAYFMHNPRFLLFMMMSPVMLVTNFLIEKRSGRRKAREDASSYDRRLSDAQSALLTALVEERHQLRAWAPDAVTAYLEAVTPGRHLWERRPGDADFLSLRVGTTRNPTTVQISGSNEHPEVSDVPASVNLVKYPILGVAGRGDSVRGLLAWLVAQVSVWHAPRDVSMSFLSSQMDVAWEWLAWLPQMRDDDNADGPVTRVACGESASASAISSLNEMIAARRRSAQAGSRFAPHVVVIRGYRNLRLTPGLPDLLQDGPRFGVYVICSDEDDRSLPEECQAVFTFPDSDSAVGILACQGQKTIGNVLSDQVTTDWCEIVARELAPLHDIGTEDHSATLPVASRLLEVLHLEEINEEDVATGWQRVGRSTKAVVGELPDGLFSLDVRADGPHGLVAGTTGSGKSELLQTLIASLALVNRPDEMNFVLVDYKGGAAFKDCARLPHTVGSVTDLDGHLTTRALESLAAELRRREHQLSAIGAKDIEDYLDARTAEDPPMPRLLIVIDEFAALVQELPDFVTGLVDIARRGRSLGVHLILATQRPAGVVSAEIKSNTNLRVALRVTDVNDSADVIDAPDAAHILKSTPGRGIARLGHSSLIPFQSARVGGRAAGVVLSSVNISPVRLEDLFKAFPRAVTQDDTSVPTDLERLVDACTRASIALGISPPLSPWLEPLPTHLSLDTLLDLFPETTNLIDDLIVPYGLSDLPSQQRRAIASFNIQSGVNLGIIGAGRSGRSSLLRLIGSVIGKYMSPMDVQIYGLDCAGGALLPLERLPHTGAIVTRDQVERANRLARLLRNIITQRQQLLARDGFANLREQRAANQGEARLPYVIVLLDGWDVFTQTFEAIDSAALVAAFTQIAQEGPAVGVTMIATGDRTLASGKVSNQFPDKLMLRVTDPTDYSYIGMPLRQAPSTVPPGRCFSIHELTETQISLVEDSTAGSAQVAAIQEIAFEAQTRWHDLSPAYRPRRVDLLPSQFAMSSVGNLPRLGESLTTLPVAVGGDTLSLYGLDMIDNGPLFLVAGPRRSGRSTTLKTMGLFALANGWTVVSIIARVSPLQQMNPTDRLFGPFTSDLSTKDELLKLLESLKSSATPSLVIADDVDRLPPDDWLSTTIEAHAESLRDSGSAVAVSATPTDLSGYRGIIGAVKKAHSGILLSPQGSTDADLFGTGLPRSAFGAIYPPGAGYLVRSGEAMRVQVVSPDNQ